MRLKYFLFLLCLIPIALNAQSPYQLSWKKESSLLGLGLVTLAGGYYLESQTDPLSFEEISELNPNDINSFDREAIYNYSVAASDASDVLVVSAHLLPALFLANKKSKSEFGKIFVLYSETILITTGFTKLTKRSTRRTRPFVYNDLASNDRKEEKGARYSFFSGHTSLTTANYFFAAKVFSDYFPDSKLKPYIWTTAVVVPALTGYLRVKGGKHYYTDVMTGFAVGALIGYMVPQLHRSDKERSLSLQPYHNGLTLRWAISK